MDEQRNGRRVEALALIVCVASIALALGGAL